ncbi:zinc finger protein 862-like [Haliotis rubra]|uniref:zinc finger protein 862-like n=1 Tax=Haliotis rubra TaxID=36100 RepID=UPI001EE50F19|nr:zinc finger protein 862-like [Haliotis rubra]
MMKRINLHMINIHCVAHRLALCTSQAAEKLPALKDYQEVVTSIYYYFKYSPNKISRISEVQKILDSPQLRYKEVHSIRWLSFYNALETVYRTLETLLAYLTNVSLSDAKAIGLKKKLQFDSVCI